MTTGEREPIGGLILRRRPGESIIIDGGRAVITVDEIGQGRVVLRFKAGPEVRIDRAELLEGVQE